MKPRVSSPLYYLLNFKPSSSVIAFFVTGKTIAVMPLDQPSNMDNPVGSAVIKGVAGHDGKNNKRKDNCLNIYLLSSCLGKAKR